MALTKAAFRRKDPSAEYSVYIYREQAPQNDNYAWERRHTTSNIHRAYKKAEKLHKSRAYKRVEIKKKSFDQKLACHIVKTLKIYDENASRPVGMLAAILGFLREYVGVV